MMKRSQPIPKQYQDLPLVPETILKKRNDLEELARKRKEAAAARSSAGHGRHGGGNAIRRQDRLVGNNRQRKDGKQGIYVKKPETFIVHARSKHNHTKRYNRVLRKGMQGRASNKKIMVTKEIEEALGNDDNSVSETEESTKPVATTKITYQANSVGADMVFVIRIKDHVGCPAPIRQTLVQSLKLKYQYDGVFVRYTEDARQMLHLVEPWVVYGPPRPSVVKDLVERRGYCRSTSTAGKGFQITGQRMAISDNTIVENALGESHGIICIDDLVHTITNPNETLPSGVDGKTLADAFMACTQDFLWPFKLSDRKSTMERRTLKITDGKLYGDIGEEINDYIQQTL
jgi:60S ribosomal protein uL30